MCGFMFEGFSDGDDDTFTDRECYVFNSKLEKRLNDRKCIHCRNYLTVNCKYIHEFVDEEGDV